MKRNKHLIALAFVAFAATIPVANWLIGNMGTVCVPDGPCLVPVGFGFFAPSGVLAVGAALVIRDYLQELTSWRWSLVAVLFGAIISATINPSIALASIAAFSISQIADLAVYTPLRKKGRAVAVIASGAIGAIFDSLIFLFVAFGSVDFWEGNTLGKFYASALVAVVLWARKL